MTIGSDRFECNTRSISLPHLAKRGPSESSSTMLSIQAPDALGEVRELRRAWAAKSATAKALPFFRPYAQGSCAHVCRILLAGG